LAENWNSKELLQLNNMKKLLSVVILFAVVFTGCRTSKNATEQKTSGQQVIEKPVTDYMEPSTWLLGYINLLQFSNPPHSEWFLKGFDTYQPVQEVIGKLTQLNKDELSIKIVMGTWCPDSRREVPRFMKILNLWQFPSEKVVLIGVDNTKQAPVGGYDTLGIERVPTFIILKNKIETGRIIENPVTSLEQDMLNILTRSEK
jgi:thiol-disulfide isomerase/thioredoxin